MTDIAYYAVHDPNNPRQMTYWRRDKTGRITPWPAEAKYGPALYKADVPKGLGAGRRQWIRTWFHTHREPWQRAIDQAIAQNPEECQARFSVFTIRCCRCGRGLTDPTSKTCGIGPECRQGMGRPTLARFALLVGRIHADSLTQHDNGVSA